MIQTIQLFINSICTDICIDRSIVYYIHLCCILVDGTTAICVRDSTLWSFFPMAPVFYRFLRLVSFDVWLSKLLHTHSNIGIILNSLLQLCLPNTHFTADFIVAVEAIEQGVEGSKAGVRLRV